MDWDDLRIAHAVARHGSLSAAARALRSTQPTVSRRLDALEQRCGVKLFERSASGIVPTPLCAALLQGMDQMERGALEVARRLATGGDGLQGRLTVTSLDWFGDHVLAPILARFGRAHPQVAVALVNEERVFNLSRREADLAFRFGAFPQEDLVERRVADVAYAAYASPAYLQRHGEPDFGAGCPGQALVRLHESAGSVAHEDWLLAQAPQAHIALRANGLRAHLAVLQSGEALGALPRWLGDADPTLRRVATPLPEPVRALRLGVHADLRDAPRVRACIDVVVAALQALAPRLNPGHG
jgi:DNA-binding transcriptional LysR family regulator